MRKPRARFWIAVGGLLLLYLGSFLFSYDRLWVRDDPHLMADVARLAPANVQEIREVHSVEEVAAALAEARARGWKVSISGSRHSQGGHTYFDTLRDKGWPIFLWTIDDEARIRWALDKKPYGVISDEAPLASQLRDAN